MNFKKLLSRQILLHDIAILFYISLITLIIPFSINEHFKFHRDEFLYIEMGKHLGWGYLELPPIFGVISFITQAILGGSLFAFRFVSALFNASMALMTGLMVRELGGKRYAQILATVTFMLYLRSGVLFQPVFLDQFIWILCSLFIIKLFKNKTPGNWILVGVILGIGLLSKYTVLLFGFGLTVGLLLTSHRKSFLTKWPWLAGLTAFIIFLPNLIWQHLHDWPFFTFISALSKQQLVNVTISNFMIMQVLSTFLAFPIAIIGLFYYFFSKEARIFQSLGWMYLTWLITLILTKGKPYYLEPAYPMLVAGGCFWIGQFIQQKGLKILKPAILIILILGAIIRIPYSIPVLSPKSFIVYGKYMSENFNIKEPLRWETGELHNLMQDYADMMGWENIVATTAKVYHSLTSEEQDKCVIIATNYGFAGAINYYGDKYNLPKSLNFNGSFYLWGPGKLPGDIIIAVGFEKEHFENWCDNVEVADIAKFELARESEVPIYLCHDPQITMQELWPRLAKYRF